MERRGDAVSAGHGVARYPRLNAKLLASGHPLPEGLGCRRDPAEVPERVLQFGEGNFLRAFVDWMFERMSSRGLFAGRAVLVQPLPGGNIEKLNEQDGRYTVLLRGIQGGQPVDQRQIVSSVSRGVNPFRDFDAFLACARNPDLRFVVSNTTEAGIRLEDDDRPDARPAHSFPAKLTQILFERFRCFDGDPARGLVLLPCELIERNGDNLKKAIAETARRWELPAGFARWFEESCVVANTLVDRIVPGYPRDEVEALTASLGYEDQLMVTGEPFHCWVIETPRPLDAELPFVQAGLDVVWTSDMTPYRERKVRILNGAHTMVSLAAYLDGKDTVGQVMEDSLLREMVRRGIEEEILPTLSLPRAELEAFAASVIERFSNPFIKHQLLSISLNSVSKYKARILATVVDYRRLRGALPRRLTFAMAALIAFYRGRDQDGGFFGLRAGVPYRIQDEPGVLELFREAWAPSVSGTEPWSMEAAARVAGRVLGQVSFWGQDLSTEPAGFRAAVTAHLHAICKDGMRAELERVNRS